MPVIRPLRQSLQSRIIFVRIGDSFYIFPVVQSPEDIRLKLIRLIQEAQFVSPNLASRLDRMRRWIAQKKSGLLMRKRHVMALLVELVEDADFWLAVQLLPEEDRDAEFAQLSQAEQYWYKYLFQAWFNMYLDIAINCLISVILLLVLIDKILMSTVDLEVLREQKISRARKALERARNLRRSRGAMGVNGICQHINDVDGDWLW